jgi:S1-C subfamily serine protease
MTSLLVITIAIVGIGCSGDDHNSSAGNPNSASATQTSSNDGNNESLSIPDIVEKLRPSVVQVQTEGATADIFGQPVPQSGVGTGFIIDEEGRIITNDHVLRLNGGQIAGRITVTLADNRTFEASVMGTDQLTDLAVIEIDADDIIPATLGSSEELRVGETVVAIGHALALEGSPTVSTGVVSAKDRNLQESERVTLTGLLQTDTAINPGNSGGPLVNTSGEVIGINTARIPGATVEGIGFAIAIDNARPIVDELLANGEIERGFLGITPVNITPGIAAANTLAVSSGVGLTTVAPNSPAARAGLQPGDIIVEIGDVEIGNSGDLVEALTEYRPGEQVEAVYYRGQERRTTNITMGSSA